MINNKLPENPNEKVDFSGSELKDIYLAGGCFWGVEAYMRRVFGVASTSVGYANGQTENPDYEQVCQGNTGHAETVHLKYDPQKVSLEEILGEFFKIIDPTTFNRQGNDTGKQYRSGIYYADTSEKEKIKDYIIKKVKPFYKRKIVTEVLPLESYYIAEEYHQSYLEKNPGGYCHISF